MRGWPLVEEEGTANSKAWLLAFERFDDVTPPNKEGICHECELRYIKGAKRECHAPDLERFRFNHDRILQP